MTEPVVHAERARQCSGNLCSAPASEQRSYPQLLVVVEGRHDIEFLKRISLLWASQMAGLADLSQLEDSGQLIFVPAGGGDFRPWLSRLAAFGCAEFHLYDAELPPVSAQRTAWAAIVNGRARCRAFVTAKRSLENYLHPVAIQAASGLQLEFAAQDDVAELAARADFDRRYDHSAWHSLSRRARRRLRDRAKHWLNTTAVERMTPALLAESDPRGEVASWLEAIHELLRSAS